MNTSLLKKIVTVMESQGVIEQSLEIVNQLLVIMKKFGKQMSQPSLVAFVQKEYPDVYDLYVLLWSSRCTVKQVLVLRQYLHYSLWDRYIVAHTSHDSAQTLLEKISHDMSVECEWDVTNPLLMVQSPTKTYRRSLRDDLAKIV